MFENHCHRRCTVLESLHQATRFPPVFGNQCADKCVRVLTLGRILGTLTGIGPRLVVEFLFHGCAFFLGTVLSSQIFITPKARYFDMRLGDYCDMM